ncbi:MAG: 5-carboxymethyl-2-hydroxymuconate Delta-isomerase [Hyphomonadaceae bacterium]|nr:5-carboxymethyl-2-hydroxymuconate Delta-isomerase [Hyphomonadaceae bacterium]
MAHAIVEWTDNLADDGFEVRPVLDLIASEMQSRSNGVFPIGGIRVRAIRLTDYVIADGAGDEDAFVNITVKMGAGRTEIFKHAFFSGLFEKLRQHFEPVFARRPFALSMYVEEAAPEASFKANTIHQRLKAAP